MDTRKDSKAKSDLAKNNFYAGYTYIDSAEI